MTAPSIPLIVHLIYRLDFGGLETLLVECINHLPANQYQHAVICLTDYTDFAKKITRPDVEIFALHKRPGLGLGTHVTLWKLLRQLHPEILHSYNLSAVEYALTARLAGVPIRIHAEHGRDIGDPHGLNPRHNALRRWMIPHIDSFVPVSNDLQQWLKQTIGVPDNKNHLIDNGVNVSLFTKDGPSNSPWPEHCFVIGTVGRIQSVKNQAGLIRAFILLRELLPQNVDSLRLSIVGDGPLLPELKQQVLDAGIDDVVWLPGARSDIAEIVRGFSVFALASLAEGTPVTLLEAMSSALPVVASRVGGMPEVIRHGEHGLLEDAGDDAAFAEAFASYYRHPELAQEHGKTGRKLIQARYSVAAMLQAYSSLYQHLLKKKKVR